MNLPSGTTDRIMWNNPRDFDSVNIQNDCLDAWFQVSDASVSSMLRSLRLKAVGMTYLAEQIEEKLGVSINIF